MRRFFRHVLDQVRSSVKLSKTQVFAIVQR